jgi:3-methyladenine DNA glycosylase AlkD
MDLKEIKNKLTTIKRTKFGICIPDLRDFAKEIARENYQEFFKVNDFSVYELKLLHAFVLGYAKDDIHILIQYFEEFIPQVNDWLVCDSLCQSFKIARKYPDIFWKFLMKYAHSKAEFESRIVSVCMLSHFLNDEYIDRVISVLDQLYTERYYSMMGVAWAIATVMAKYPTKCQSYLQSESCHLDKTTYKKSLQKIKESFRTSKDIFLSLPRQKIGI